MKKPLLAFKILIACGLVLLCTSAFALDIPRDCSDLEMLQHKWETQYFYDLKFNGYLINGVPPLKCDSLPYKFVKAIWAIETLKTSPEFGNIYAQLKTHVREFQIIPQNGIDGKVLCGNTTTEIGRIALYLCAFSESEKKDTYPWPEEYYVRNLIRLVSSIIHELRHLQIPNYEHVECPITKTKKGCDLQFTPNINNANPFSFQILYLRDLLRNNQFDDADYELLNFDSILLQRNSFVESVSE